MLKRVWSIYWSSHNKQGWKGTQVFKNIFLIYFKCPIHVRPNWHLHHDLCTFLVTWKHLEVCIYVNILISDGLWRFRVWEKVISSVLPSIFANNLTQEKWSDRSSWWCDSGFSFIHYIYIWLKDFFSATSANWNDHCIMNNQMRLANCVQVQLSSYCLQKKHPLVLDYFIVHYHNPW